MNLAIFYDQNNYNYVLPWLCTLANQETATTWSSSAVLMSRPVMSSILWLYRRTTSCSVSFSQPLGEQLTQEETVSVQRMRIQWNETKTEK